MRIFFVTLVALGLFAGGVHCGYKLIPKAKNRFSPPIQKIQSLRMASVFCLGRLKPKDDRDISAPVGSRIEKLLVKEGQFVKTGKILAYLDTYETLLQEKKYMQSQLRENKNRLLAETAYARSMVLEAKKNVEKLKKSILLEIAGQKIQITLFKEKWEYSTQELKRLKSTNGISKQNIAKQEFSAKVNKKNWLFCKHVLEEIKLNGYMAVSLAKLQVHTAQKRLQQIKSSIPINSLSQRIKWIEKQINKTIVRSSSSGQILKIFVGEGETARTKPILRMGNTKQMQVIAEVHQSDIQRVKKGQQVVITTPAISKPLTGTVQKIGCTIYKNDILGIDPSAKKDARVVEVEIYLNDSVKTSSFSNLQVTVKIDTKKTLR